MRSPVADIDGNRGAGFMPWDVSFSSLGLSCSIQWWTILFLAVLALMTFSMWNKELTGRLCKGDYESGRWKWSSSIY